MNRIRKFIAMAICLIICFCDISCIEQRRIADFGNPEWDGRFWYADQGYGYEIVGTEYELGEFSTDLEILYIPSVYKGKPIIDYTVRIAAWNVEIKDYGIDVSSVRILYYPYNRASGLWGRAQYEKVFMPDVNSSDYYHFSSNSNKNFSYTQYIPSVEYENCYVKMQNREHRWIVVNKWDFVLERINAYAFEFFVKMETEPKYHVVVQKANTAYMFNYEGAPNENYYAIDEFERGGLITKYPYDPYREGYDFGGWYKDEECSQIWDFAVDTLPAPTYDENGDLEYVETRLYAKWDKQQ